jgi:hypothetical protein
VAADVFEEEVRVAREIDWAVFEKAVDITAAAVRGTMGGEGSQPASYAAEVFRQVWGELKVAAEELPDRSKTGF